MSLKDTTVSTGPIIEAEAVTKCFGNRVAVRKMSFQVHAGDVYGLVGENGAGKTTTIRLLLGLLEPTEGRVRLFGRPRSSLDFSTKCEIGFVLEANGIYDDLSVEDNLDFYAQIYRVTDPKKRIAELLDFVQLDSRPTDKARTLSKGMRQKLAIARALLSDPQVLILDEPTSGLDPRFQKEILLMTANLARSGKTVLLSSHNLREVQEACTIVAFVAHGAIRVAEPVRALLARYGSAKKLFRFENTEEQIKAELLLRSDNKARFVPTAQGLQVLVETKEAEDQILAYLLAHGIKLQQVERMPVDLNDIFDLVV